MTDTAAKVKLFWIEEQELYQKLYNAVFTSDSIVQVIGNAAYGDFESLKSDLSANKPDVLLIGCKSVSSEIIEELARIQSKFSIGIVLLVSYLKYDDLLSLRQFIDNTRSKFGFLFKKSIASTEQLFSIISLVNMGQNVIDPTLTDLMSSDKEKVPIAGGLTAREIEILNLISKGYTNVAISESLCIDVKTVRHHINNIYSKLKISDEFDNRHPRVSATNVYLRLTGQLSFDDNIIQE
jgi:DNA-binding NarL/FixJ family response regulator